MNVLIIGKGCSGKGSQNQKLREIFDYKHFSSGDMLREIAKEDTEIGVLVRRFMSKGENVPSEYVNPACLEILRRQGHKLLDGFPRNIVQAQFVIENVGIDNVVAVNLLASDALCIGRAKIRRQCGICKETQPDNDTGKCIFCSDEKNTLVIRSDDAIIEERMLTYRNETVPMVEYLKQSGINVFDIDVETGTDATFPLIAEFLKPYLR